MMMRSFLSRLARRKSPVDDAAIIAAMDPWTLACAVGAENGSTGSSADFDLWLELSRANWLPKVKTTTGVSGAQIIKTLRRFVEKNRHKDYRTVLADESGESDDWRRLKAGVLEEINDGDDSDDGWREATCVGARFQETSTRGQPRHSPPSCQASRG